MNPGECAKVWLSNPNTSGPDDLKLAGVFWGERIRDVNSELKQSTCFYWPTLSWCARAYEQSVPDQTPLMHSVQNLCAQIHILYMDMHWFLPKEQTNPTSTQILKTFAVLTAVKKISLNRQPYDILSVLVQFCIRLLNFICSFTIYLDAFMY